MEDVNYLDWASLVLVIVGALEWGLIGLSAFAGQGNLSVLQNLLGGVANGQLLAAVYVLVGLAGLYQVYFGYQLYENQ